LRPAAEPAAVWPRLWKLTDGHELASFEVDAVPFCCAVCPNGKTILAGDDKGVIYCLRFQ
jgi:hypothetical protein